MNYFQSKKKFVHEVCIIKVEIFPPLLLKSIDMQYAHVQFKEDDRAMPLCKLLLYMGPYVGVGAEAGREDMPVP